ARPNLAGGVSRALWPMGLGEAKTVVIAVTSSQKGYCCAEGEWQRYSGGWIIPARRPHDAMPRMQYNIPQDNWQQEARIMRSIDQLLHEQRDEIQRIATHHGVVR